MVFSSIPVYLDPPNWHQQPNQLQANDTNTSQLLPLPPLPTHPQPPHVGGGGSSIRPGLMADRAQLAKIPPPEAALKCPRCDSTNTKFCYFNNYSLSQPRHFCKTCRRYWTRGGALRNVPVGGGCRRNNKKNKRSSRSKSPAASTDKHSLSSSTSATINTSGIITPELVGTNLNPFMASLHQNLRGYGVGNMDHMGFQLGGHGLSTSGGGGVDQWRLQQFPLLNGFESTTTSTVSYPFQSVEAPCGLVGDIGLSSRVKLEDNGGLNLSTSHMSMSQNNQYYLWTDLSSGLASSSTSHLV